MLCLRQVNTPSSWDKFQNCCIDMYLIRFLPNFAVFCMFLWISRDFADLPEFRGSATAQNIRSPSSNNKLLRCQNSVDSSHFVLPHSSTFLWPFLHSRPTQRYRLFCTYLIAIIQGHSQPIDLWAQAYKFFGLITPPLVINYAVLGWCMQFSGYVEMKVSQAYK